MISARRAVMTVGCALAAACILATPARVHANPAQFPRPAVLEPDVLFWERIYSKVTTHGGLLHDDRHLDIVYEELTFPPGLSGSERSALVDTVRAHYERVLRHLGTGAREDLSDDENRVLTLFPANVSDATLTEAAEHVRFQLGQADRFREGLVRSGAWEKHVEETLRREGLPGELSALPHVESSFNPRAYSKVGAAGLWQFMRSTGKRWLRVDATVDERLDPYKSTLAAAQFLNINYNTLGTWPLALTAWNHGAGGMRRAKEELGTDDIVTIVRNYQGRTFGFASRNFYVSFLAALDVDRNADKFFGRIDRMPHDDSRTVRLPALMPAQALEKSIGTDRETLRALNLSLLDPVWAGRKPVPRGFELRVPAGVDAGRLLARMGQAARDDKERTVVVGKGETLDRIATQYGLRSRELADYNQVSARDVRPGMTLRLPAIKADEDSAPSLLPESSVAAPETPSAAESNSAVESEPTVDLPEVHLVAHGESLSSIARSSGITVGTLLRLNGLARPDLVREGQKLRIHESVSEAGKSDPAATAADAPVKLPAVATSSSPHAAVQGVTPSNSVRAPAVDSADYRVADSAIRVQSSETIGHLAQWAGITRDRLRAINQLKTGESVDFGRRLKIELSGVDTATFEARRSEYHRAQQAAFLSRHRVTGTEPRRCQAGDTLWTLTRHGQIPFWLLREYNPDVDFGAIHVGMNVNVPIVEAATASTPVSSAEGVKH